MARLIFIPEIIKNPNNPDACIKGAFVYQKKKKNEPWQTVRELELKSLKAGEGARWEIHTEELLTLWRGIAGLWRSYRHSDRLPTGTVELISVTEREKALLELGDIGLTDLLDKNGEEGQELAARILKWLASKSTAAASELVTHLEELETSQISTIVRLASLRRLQKLWIENTQNDDEEFWQKELQKSPYVFSLILPYAVLILKGKAYVGGKNYTNQGGNIADFLVASKLSNNCAIVELKTPTTELLGTEYRDGVYAISRELSGGVVQTRNYLEELIVNAGGNSFLPEGASATSPRGILICGSSSELDTSEKRKSFELFRNGMTGLQILTFDEFFEKASTLIGILEGEESAPVA